MRRTGAPDSGWEGIEAVPMRRAGTLFIDDLERLHGIGTAFASMTTTFIASARGQLVEAETPDEFIAELRRRGIKPRQIRQLTIRFNEGIMVFGYIDELESNIQRQVERGIWVGEIVASRRASFSRHNKEGQLTSEVLKPAVEYVEANAGKFGVRYERRSATKRHPLVTLLASNWVVTVVGGIVVAVVTWLALGTPGAAS